MCVNIYKHKGQIRSPFFNCPIAGQDLVANGGFMQIWGRCLIARTEERRLLKCVGRSELGLKKVYFSIFGNYWGANNHEIVRAQRRTELGVHDSVPHRTPASGWDRLEVHFSVVKMLSTAFFFYFHYEMLSEQVIFTFMPLILFLLLQWSFSATYLTN